MLWNYLKVTFRNVIRHKSFSIINILGLSVGIAAFLIIYIYLEYEFGFDKHFSNSEKIYRVVSDLNWDSGDEMNTVLAPAPVGDDLAEDYADIIAATCLANGSRSLFEILSKDTLNLNERYYEDEYLATDSNFFQVFKHEFIAGNPDYALLENNSIVLTESMAKKYYGNENAMGRLIRSDNEDTYKVTGIIEDIPKNSHFYYKMILNSPEISELKSRNWFASIATNIYIRTTKVLNIPEFEQEMREFYKRRSEMEQEYIIFRLEPLQDIHLKSDRMYDFSIKGNINNLYALSIVGILILLAACINYMNLSTARSSYRTKEIGMRKVSGASQSQLIMQFMGESLFITFVSLFLP